MNKQSNTYTIFYAIIMVVIVAAVLAVVATWLKPIQQVNIDTEKKSAILGSVSLYNAEEASNDPAGKDAYVDKAYKEFIVDAFLVNSKGERVGDATAAFTVLGELKVAYAAEASKRELPVFISKDKAGKVNYIFPVYGKGLWGPVWGYIALGGDLNTISGVVLDHKGETPGLGAEITAPEFEGQYIGKKIFNNEEFVGVVVTKGAGSSEGNDHAVDAITGGTITCRGVQNMVVGCMSDYVPFIKKTQLK